MGGGRSLQGQSGGKTLTCTQVREGVDGHLDRLLTFTDNIAVAPPLSTEDMRLTSPLPTCSNGEGEGENVTLTPTSRRVMPCGSAREGKDWAKHGG